MVAILLVFFIQICAWWFLEDDVIEPLGAYHQIFCHPRELVGHMTVRKAMNIFLNIGH